MAQPLIDVPTLEARLRRTFAGDELTQAQSYIDDASALVRDEAGDDFLDDSGALVVPDAVVPVVVSAVRRALFNPGGLGHEQIGSYAYSGAPQDGVFLTKPERRIVRRAAGKLGAGTVTLEGWMPLYGTDTSQ